MADPTEEPTLIEPDEPLDAADALERAEDVEDDLLDEGDPFDFTEELGDSDLLAIDDEPPPPPGKSYAFDFATRRFVRAGSSSMPIFGMDTLRQRIQKILVTSPESAPVLPDGYGMEDPDSMIGIQTSEVSAADLERRIEEALVGDPLVAGIDDFELDVQPTSDVALVSFTVVLVPTEDADAEDPPEELTIEGLELPVG